MADHDEAAGVAAEELPQPGDRVRVQVVRRLVQQQGLGVGEQDPGQLHPAPLTSGEGAQRLAEHPGGQAEVGGDSGRFTLRGPAALRAELGIQAGVAIHRLLPHRLVLAGHVRLGTTDPAHHLVQVAGGEHSVPGELVQVASAWVLRQVADRAVVRDRAAGRLALAGQGAGQRSLSGAVAPHQTDPHSGVDAKVRPGEELTGPDSELHFLRTDHWSHSTGGPVSDRTGFSRRAREVARTEILGP